MEDPNIGLQLHTGTYTATLALAERLIMYVCGIAIGPSDPSSSAQEFSSIYVDFASEAYSHGSTAPSHGSSTARFSLIGLSMAFASRTGPLS